MTILSSSDFESLKNIQLAINDGAANISLSDIEINSFGRVALPVDEDGVSLDGNFLHHTGLDTKGTDVWGKPETICSAMSMAKIAMPTLVPVANLSNHSYIIFL